MTVSEWLRQAQMRLTDSGNASAKLEAQLLAAHILRVDRPWLLAHGEEDFPDLPGEVLLQRRESHEPLAYILGYREFYGREFLVNRYVLIPRHETETLVEVALLKTSRPQDLKTVLDLGTGSGILAITYKLECPGAEVTATDISTEALEVARANAERLNADVRFVLSDGFTELTGESFDLILTNPPYIGLNEDLSHEVRSHEPHVALYGGETGMEFYEMLADEAKHHLNDGGRLVMEVGYEQAQTVKTLFEEHEWHIKGIHKDLSGIDRVVEAQSIWACAS